MYPDEPVALTEPVFRPPSEANSLILQVTNGCSWNQCTFCEMYTAPQKKFGVKAEDRVLREIAYCGEQMSGLRRVFLGDGDAMVLSFRRLRTILNAIREHLPTVTRVSAYCLPRNLANKTVDDLKALQALGLKLIYIGAESGNDDLLVKVNKSESRASTVEAIRKAKAAGIKTSVMIINGLGGRVWSQAHAMDSARLVNDSQPDYLATLVLFHPAGDMRFRKGFGDGFEPLDDAGLCEEMARFLEATDLESTIFRSDHVSNHLVLKGVLGRDKARLVAQAQAAAAHFKGKPHNSALRLY